MSHAHHATKERLFTSSYCCIVGANFLLYFGFWMVAPVLPFFLKERFGCAEGLIGLLLCCYTVSALLVRPFSGHLLDTFSRKPLYILAYCVFTLFFPLYALCFTLVAFVVLRVLHGFAFGTVTVGGNTLVVDITPSSRRSEALGYYGLANNLGLSTGPMVGLFLHGVLPFSWIFTVSMLSCGVGLALAACVRVPVKKPEANVGTENTDGNTLAKVKIRGPRLDRFILVKGLRASLALALLSFPYSAAVNYVAVYAKEIGIGVSSGFFFTMLASGMGLSRIFAGKFADRGYVTECIHYGFYLVIAAFALLAALPLLGGRAMSACYLAIPFLQGVGFGTIFPAYNSLYVNLAPHNRRATATSTYLTSWDTGGGVGILMSGVIAQWTGGFSAVFATGAVLCIVAMVYFNRVVTPHYRKNVIVHPQKAPAGT